MSKSLTRTYFDNFFAKMLILDARQKKLILVMVHAFNFHQNFLINIVRYDGGVCKVTRRAGSLILDSKSNTVSEKS